MDLYPPIRAGADAPKSVLGKQRPRRPVLVALVHEVLNGERFTDLVDLTEAVKTRAARLRIAYDSTKVAEAIRTVAHVRPVLVTKRHAQVVEDVAAETGAVSRAAAKRIVEELLQRVGVQLRTMPDSGRALTADAINQFKRAYVWHR